jgi:hypothetical protein
MVRIQRYCPCIALILKIIHRKAADIFARMSSIVMCRYGGNQFLLVAGGRSLASPLLRRTTIHNRLIVSLPRVVTRRFFLAHVSTADRVTNRNMASRVSKKKEIKLAIKEEGTEEPVKYTETMRSRLRNFAFPPAVGASAVSDAIIGMRCLPEASKHYLTLMQRQSRVHQS